MKLKIFAKKVNIKKIIKGPKIREFLRSKKPANIKTVTKLCSIIKIMKISVT